MSYKILIVDDEEKIRKSLSRHFKLKNYEVETASNGVEALKKLELKSYQVVISDIVMPEMDGVKLLKNIRDEYPMIKVIMMTGYVTLENGLACLRYGAETVVFKPLTDLDELDQAVERGIKYLELWEKKLSLLIGMKEKK